MSCMHSSGWGFQEVYPLRLWSQLSRSGVVKVLFGYRQSIDYIVMFHLQVCRQDARRYHPSSVAAHLLVRHQWSPP